MINEQRLALLRYYVSEVQRNTTMLSWNGQCKAMHIHPRWITFVEHFVDDIWRGLNQSVRVWFTINQTETLKANNSFWDRTWCILTKLFNNYISIIMICNRSNPFLILQKWLFKRITKSITKINQIFFIPMDETTTKLYTAQCRHKIGQLLSPNYFPISC